MRGARWAGEGGAGPPTREKSGRLQAAAGRFVSLEEGPLTCPSGPAQHGARQGAAGAGAGSWRLRKVAAWGGWRRVPRSVQALPLKKKKRNHDVEPVIN